MSAAEPPYVAPACRLAQDRPQQADAHEHCPGPYEVRTPDGVLVLTGDCACTCHQNRS
ncbi:hypothetical protein ACMA1D_01790 [Streptomyces sp. 796.1]|uniref:hypothetical protein n=1 Tax=Streptomyces sp. 796.1 TaxID=3163029 RepID=UPI0039C93D33